MKLSKLQYRDIMHSYDQIHQRNLAIERDRKQEILTEIPEIAQIDESIAHKKISLAKDLLFHRKNAQEVSESGDITDLQNQKRALLLRHHYPADYLEPVYTCKKCQDTGYVNNHKCTCFQSRIKELFIEQSNLKDYIQQDNFAHFRTGYYSKNPYPDKKMSPYENILSVLNQCKNYIQYFSSNEGHNLVIYGNAGVGKTFLTRCIGASLLDKGYQVLYLTAYQLFSQLADYTFRRDDYEGESLNDFLNADILIIDDLGTEMTNSFINSQLFLCINERILKNKSTIISTNLSMKQLSSTYTERVFSRFVESYTFLNIYGEDIRLKKALSSS